MNRTKSPVIIALTDPINLSILALAVASGLCAAWWWAPVGILLWGLMVLLVTRDPSLRLAKRLDDRAPLAQRYQRLYNRVERAQISIFNNISQAKRKFKPLLKPIHDSVEKLVDQAHELCERMTILENHRIVSTSTEDLNSQIKDIDSLLALTQDPLTTREYTESREALMKRLADMNSVDRQLSRTDAQLESLTHELNRVMTEMVRIQALDPDEAKDHVKRLVAALDDQHEQLKKFEVEISQI
jgi:predicted nuclease with TOPRIM domain